MRELPALAPNEIWACSRGCGDCKPRESTFEYSRTEYPNGNVDSKSERVFVSDCCNADLLLWDDDAQDFKKWDYVDNAAPSPQEQA